MEDVAVVDAPVGGLSQVERVVDTFVAPSKTFADIKRSAAWWMPFLLVCILSTCYSFVLVHKVGYPALVDGIVHQTPALEERLANATPEDAAKIRGTMEMQFKFSYAAPVFLLIVALIVAGVLLLTANFGFGGTATYGQMLAVWFYGTLPMAFITLLTIIVLYAGMGAESFNIKNPVGTNLGYFLQGGSSPHWLVTFATSIDVFTIWAAFLLGIGVSIVAGIKRSSGMIVVFGWLILVVLCKTAFSALTGS